MQAKAIKNAVRGLRRRFERGKATITAAIANGMVVNGSPSLRASVVVVTVTVSGTVEDALERSAEAGLIVQVVPAGAPLQLNATGPMKPSEDNMRL
jgi:hypothetical protein